MAPSPIFIFTSLGFESKVYPLDEFFSLAARKNNLQISTRCTLCSLLYPFIQSIKRVSLPRLKMKNNNSVWH